MIPYQQKQNHEEEEGRGDVCDESLGWNSFSTLFVLSNQSEGFTVSY